jgi:iron-sulfur cluster repair protein YtfE (RIC family)
MSSRPMPQPIDPSLTVGEVLRRWPGAIAPLGAFGIDRCCGGAVPLREAADEAGIAVDDLVAAIERAVAPEARR